MWHDSFVCDLLICDIFACGTTDWYSLICNWFIRNLFKCEMTDLYVTYVYSYLTRHIYKCASFTCGSSIRDMTRLYVTCSRVTYLYVARFIHMWLIHMWLVQIGSYSIICDLFMCDSLTRDIIQSYGHVSFLNSSTYNSYGVATISRLLKIMGLFCRIESLLYGSFAKETYSFKEPTNRSNPIHTWLLIRNTTHMCLYRRIHIWCDSYICDSNRTWLDSFIWPNLFFGRQHVSSHMTLQIWLFTYDSSHMTQLYVAQLIYMSLIHTSHYSFTCDSIICDTTHFYGHSFFFGWQHVYELHI